MIGYRILDDKGGCPHTLFHGVHGSRKLLLDKWIDAEVKPVSDGTGIRVYQSGFHFLPTKEEALTVLKGTFKHLDHRVVCRVQVQDTWPKSHSKFGVLLARRMKIGKNDWARRERVTKG